MRLIKCHVENFGTLCNFDIDFDLGLSIIKEDNGFGKTTTAAFIKAMFYGFADTRKANLNDNERRKYDPWQGGNYGGSLDFECDKGTFRIERFFGEKSKNDTFKVFDVNKGALSNEFTENIGVELFGIDAESFERSIFMPQQRLDSGLNASLNAKLTGLVENSDDIGNFDSAMAELKKQQSARGVKGRIDSVLKEINELERQMSDKRIVADGLPLLKEERTAYYKEVQSLSVQMEDIRKKISIASDISAAKSTNERRNELLEEAEKQKNEIARISQKYASGLPGEDKLLHIASLAESYSSTVSATKLLEADASETERMKNAEDFFKNGVPSFEEITELRAVLGASYSARAKAEAIGSRQDITAVKSSKKQGKGFTLLMLLAAVFALVGIGLLFVSPEIGITFIVAGIVCAGVSGFMTLKGMIIAGGQNAVDIEALRQQYKELRDKAELCEAEVKAFTSKYYDGDLQTALDIIAARLNEYNALKQSSDQRKQKQTAENDKITALYKELSDFFVEVCGVVPENFNTAVMLIRDDIRALKTANEGLTSCEGKLKEISVVEIPQGAEELDREELILKETELGNRLDFCRNALTSLENRISAAELCADALQELASQLDQKRADKDELQKMLAVAEKTAELLSEARDGLSSRYMSVLKDGFKRYTAAISGGDIGEFMLDNNLTLNLQRQSGAKEKEYFSEGFRDMLDICMRLALIDALYTEEKPMLILDDPFVNLDDARVEQALTMLTKLAEQRQILYLTCHTSRMPK